MKVTGKEGWEHLTQLNLACELVRLIRHFFPDLLPLLKQIPDPRNQSYITYPAAVLLMPRILSSVFYISSMTKTSEEFNCVFCGALEETILVNGDMNSLFCAGDGKFKSLHDIRSIPLSHTSSRFLTNSSRFAIV